MTRHIPNNDRISVPTIVGGQYAPILKDSQVNGGIPKEAKANVGGVSRIITLIFGAIRSFFSGLFSKKIYRETADVKSLSERDIDPINDDTDIQDKLNQRLNDINDVLDVLENNSELINPGFLIMKLGPVLYLQMNNLGINTSVRLKHFLEEQKAPVLKEINEKKESEIRELQEQKVAELTELEKQDVDEFLESNPVAKGESAYTKKLQYYKSVMEEKQYEKFINKLRDEVVNDRNENEVITKALVAIGYLN